MAERLRSVVSTISIACYDMLSRVVVGKCHNVQYLQASIAFKDITAYDCSR